MYRAVIDPAPDHAAFALLDGDEILAVKRCAMRGRDAAALPEFLLNTIKEHGVDFHDIKRWTVGSGPGSFTGLRLVSALVSAWCLGKEDVCSRNVPGAIALAGMLHPAPGETVGAVYDGRNREILYFGVRGLENGDLAPAGETAVLNKEQAEKFFADRSTERLAAFASEAEAIAKVLPAGVTPEIFEYSDTVMLDRTEVQEFDSDLTKLVYIRPAVYTQN